jgi:hypothetical protein
MIRTSTDAAEERRTTTREPWNMGDSERRRRCAKAVAATCLSFSASLQYFSLRRSHPLLITLAQTT